MNRIKKISLFIGAFLFSTMSMAMEPDVLYEKLSPSVWVIYAYDGEGVKMASGSGVVIAPEQMITNCHVLTKAKSLTVQRRNTTHKARLLFADVDRDLCLLKVPGMIAPSVAVAPLSAIRVGERVIAIGAPLGLELTLSDGLVSSFIRDENDKITRIQISVPISHGSSGGGLFDLNGRLIGITNAIMDKAQNLNFAIPAEWIKEVPKRGAQALAKLREEEKDRIAEQKSVTKSAPGKPGAGALLERQLTGTEFLVHIHRLGTVEGVKQNGNAYQFELNPNGRVYINNLDKPSSGDGNYSIKDTLNQLCLSVSGAGTWSYWTDCYRLFAIDKRQFVLRSVTDSSFFKYYKD
jgi:hypothetical protein